MIIQIGFLFCVFYKPELSLYALLSTDFTGILWLFHRQMSPRSMIVSITFLQTITK